MTIKVDLLPVEKKSFRFFEYLPLIFISLGVIMIVAGVSIKARNNTSIMQSKFEHVTVYNSDNSVMAEYDVKGVTNLDQDGVRFTELNTGKFYRIKPSGPVIIKEF